MRLHHRWRLSLNIIFLLTLLSSRVEAQPSYTALINDQPALCSVPVNGTAYFTFTSAAVPYQQTFLLSMAALTGFPSLYVSLTSPTPSSSSFTYAASYATGGVVTILTQPPWTAYIAVVASPYSSSNATLTATAYDPASRQKDTIVLSEAQPQSSALAANEYRYYLYVLRTDYTSLTIADTETIGSTVIVVNGPNTTELPNITTYQWSMLSSSLHVVNLPNATAGVYSIGVWSNVTSIFSLIALSSTSIQPMQLGVVYPGVIQGLQYRYYSLYLGSQLLPTSGYLAITLTSLTGDADLYCSNTTNSPSSINSRWSSFLTAQLDEITVPSAQLWPGIIYCAVEGWASNPGYTLASSFGSFAAVTALVINEGSTASAGQSLYSYTFEGNSSQTGSFVTVSVVSEHGACQVKMQPYGQTLTGQRFSWSSPSYQSLQLVQVSTADICGGSDFASAIPGTSPLLCQLDILVATNQATSYRLTVGGAQSVVPLVAGQLVEAAASALQSSSFTLTVPDNLSNITVLVSITNEANDVVLTAGIAGIGGSLNRALWTVSQQPGQSLVGFQLDWSDPLLPARSVVANTYAVTISTQQNATFTISYTLTNLTGNGGTITPLIDGNPQQGLLQPGQYAFFFLAHLPTAGWPYSITFAIEWQAGSGRMLVSMGDGTQVGPLPGSSQILNTDANPLLIVTPESGRFCDPTTFLPSGLPCGYAVSVLTDSQVQGPAQFTITATTGKWMRSLTAWAPTGAAELNGGSVDYWQATQVNSYTYSATLILVVTITSGSVAVYASNTTVMPNASQAQWSLQRVELVDSLQIFLGTTTVNADFYYTIACLGSSDCAYQLQHSTFFPSYLRAVSARQISTLAIVPGGINWFSYDTSLLTSIGFVTIQVQPTLGTPSLYVSCSPDITGATSRPDERQYTWSAEGPGPLVIELTDLPDIGSACVYLIMGIRALGATSTIGSLSIDVAGVQQDITQQLFWGVFGLVTPSYPVSYFLYSLPSYSTKVDALTFTVTMTPASCLSTTQLLVSSNTSVMHPSAAIPGVTYTFMGSVVTFGTRAQILSVVISNTSIPAGSLRPGPYYLAIISTSPTTTCQYQLQSNRISDTLLQVGETMYLALGSDYPAYVSFPLQSLTALSFGIVVQTNGGWVAVVCGS